jgi:hypothetical protein
MRQICDWLAEVALADKGFDVKAHEGDTALIESFAKEKGISERLEALNYLGSRSFGKNDTVKMSEVMTQAHFANYFGTALSREFYRQYTHKMGTWKAYTYPDTAPDFRLTDRMRMTEPGTLHRRREKAEAKATSISDAILHWGLEEFSRQFDVSWQVILADDLNEIKKVPRNMVDAARRFEDAFVSNLYDNAVTQATLAALGVPWAGTGRLTAANLAIGINAMMARTDAAGNQMNISGLKLVIPPILSIQASVILESLLMAGVATNDKNVLGRYITGVYVDPYIATAGANVPWYLFADPSEIPAVTVGRLIGYENPFCYKEKSDIEQVEGSIPPALLMGSYATGDIQWTVEDIIGGWDSATLGGVTDFRGIYYSSGTTP